jgi:predicted nuclease of predicted toxin-antitoxin system
MGEFVSRFLVTHTPYKLLFVSTGNIDNKSLEALLISRMPKIVSALQSHAFIELNRLGLIIHI